VDFCVVKVVVITLFVVDIIGLSVVDVKWGETWLLLCGFTVLVEVGGPDFVVVFWTEVMGNVVVSPDVVVVKVSVVVVVVLTWLLVGVVFVDVLINGFIELTICWVILPSPKIISAFVEFTLYPFMVLWLYPGAIIIIFSISRCIFDKILPLSSMSFTKDKLLPYAESEGV
jgi:hypothetical protein